jgi:hypothetical protein
MTSTFAISAAPSCNLSENDRAVLELNARFDNGEMRGEDHVIGLMLLHDQRMVMVKACVVAGSTTGILKSDLRELKVYIQDELDAKVREINESIRISIENDRMGMATQLMMERDLTILEARNLEGQIDELIKQAARG